MVLLHHLLVQALTQPPQHIPITPGQHIAPPFLGIFPAIVIDERYPEREDARLTPLLYLSQQVVEGDQSQILVDIPRDQP